VCEHHADVCKRKTKKQTDKYKAMGCRYCPQASLSGLMVCAQHRDRNRVRCKKYHAQLKAEVVEHYGGFCTCCKENQIEFLTIDHVDGGGNEHRRIEKVGSGGSFYSWLKRNSFPTGFQVLCWNCNAAKGANGCCPHNSSCTKRCNMSQICVIMQGASGSGKSTLAKQIAGVIDAEIFSTDDFHVESDGMYRFKPEQLGLFHKKNQERAIVAMQAGKNVIIDNTNIKKFEAKPYVQAALQVGATIRFVRALGDFKNVHGVPDDKVQMMKEKLEDLSVEGCLASVAPWDRK
jgi:adenylate kinase family enzyme